MKPGLLKCKELTILGYVVSLTKLMCFTYDCVIAFYSLRQTSLTGESGVHLKEIFETLPNLATVE